MEFFLLLVCVILWNILIKKQRPLTEKMTSGDVIQVAEVVRDLSHAQINKGI